MSDYYCPNERDGDGMRYPQRHQMFVRRVSREVETRILGNGRQWALDVDRVVAERQVGVVTCETCGAIAHVIPTIDVA